MQKYKYVFFDLDKTLWDIYANGKISLEKMYLQFKLDEVGINDLPLFISLYNKHNDFLWDQFRQNKISRNALRSTRFKYTLKDFGIKNTKLTKQLSEYFYYHTPRRGMLIKDAKEVLDYLHKKYQLLIITNGFDDVQSLKLKHSDILHYFNHIVTSDLAKAPKPDKRIFQYALDLIKAEKEECIMIGDDINADCIGALNFGIDQVFFNPNNQLHDYSFTFEIAELQQLKQML